MRNPFSRKQEPETTRQLVVLNSGELVSQATVRSHIEKSVQRVISTGSVADNHLLAAAVSISVPSMVCINYHSTVTATIPIVAHDEQGSAAPYIPMKYMLDNRMRWLIRDIDKSLLIWGYALVRKHYNHAKVPTLLEFLHPLDVRINTDGNNNITDYYLLRDREPLMLGEVIYISEFDLQNTGNPTSRLENAFAYVGLERGIVTHAASFFFNGASIAGVLTIEGAMTDDKMDSIEKKFKERFRGARNAFKIAILEQNVTYTPISVAPADLAMSELSDEAKQFVCASFGVNPALVGLGDVSDPLSALSTLRETKRNFVDMEATPSLDFILDNLNTQWALIDFSVPIALSSDATAMAMLNDGISTDDMGVATSGLSSGIFTIDEAREHLGYKPFDIEEGFILRDPGYANVLYDDGTITLNQKRKMLKLPPVLVDLVKVDGKTYKKTDWELVADNNLKQLEAPAQSPFMLMSGYGSGALAQIEAVNLAHLPEDAVMLSAPYPTAPTRSSDIVIVEGVARQLTPQLIIGVDLSGHQLVNLARRELGRALSDESGITWIDAENWRVELVHIDRWSPGDIVNMTRMIKWDLFNRTEVWTGDYFIEGNSVYLRLDNTDKTQEMIELVRSDLDSVAIKSMDANPVMAIRLCNGDIRQDMLPSTSSLGSMPIVFTKIVAYAGDKPQHKWRLRAYLDKPNQALLSKQRDELAMWQQRVARNGLGAEWQIDYLPEHVVRFVRGDDIVMDALELEEDSHVRGYYTRRGTSTIAELFDTARRMLTVRALQALRLDWELFVEALISDTRAGNIKDRRRFGELLRGEMGRFARRAYLDGLTDGGILDASLSEDDDDKIKTMLAEQSSFVSSLSETLFKGDGISDAEAAGKPSAWWRGSVLPFYQEGFASAGANPMMEFVGDDGEDSCRTCQHLQGQRHRHSVWRKNGLDMVGGAFIGQHTDCEGHKCRHLLVVVVARANGSIRTEEEINIESSEVEELAHNE